MHGYMHDLYACWLLGTSITSALLCVKCEVTNCTVHSGAAFKSKAPGDSQGSPNHTTTTTTTYSSLPYAICPYVHSPYVHSSRLLYGANPQSINRTVHYLTVCPVIQLLRHKLMADVPIELYHTENTTLTIEILRCQAVRNHRELLEVVQRYPPDK